MLYDYLIVYLLSCIKFVLGPLTGTARNLHPLLTALCTVAGMMTTVIVVTNLGKPARNYLLDRVSKNRKVFTPRNRKIVKLWKSYGLLGVSLLTPLLFSPIGGALITVSFGEHRHKVWRYMLLSAVLWGLVFAYAGDGLHQFYTWVMVH